MNLCLACNVAEPTEALSPFCSVECLHVDPRQSKNPILQRILALFDDRKTGAGGPGGMLPIYAWDDRMRWYLAGALDAQATGSDNTATEHRHEFDPRVGQPVRWHEQRAEILEVRGCSTYLIEVAGQEQCVDYVELSPDPNITQEAFDAFVREQNAALEDFLNPSRGDGESPTQVTEASPLTGDRT